MISERLKKVRPLSKKDNSVEDANASMAWDREITDEKGIVYIDWRVVTGLSDNICAGAEVDTFFLTRV